MDHHPDLKALHVALDPQVRDVSWVSNCAGEIFLDDEEGVRIGHFQGDAALAAFAVAAHNNELALRNLKNS